MYYFNYRDELYHYGRKGMKWGENIFTKGLDALNNKIKAADAKATGDTSSFKIPSYSEYKAKYGGKNTSTTSKTSTSKKTSTILNMDQRKIDDRARVLASLASGGKAKSGSGKKGRGGKGKKGGGSKSKASKSSKQETAKKEETKAALEEAKAKVEEAKATTTDAVKTETKSNVDYSKLSASEIASKAMNGEFASLDEMKEKLGDRYEEVLNELKKQLGIEENADDESIQKAYEEKIQTANGEATIKRLYQKIFPNTKKE